MSEARDKIIAIIQKERPHFTPEQCEANADEICAELKAEARVQVETEIDANLPEPLDESELKRRIKKKGGVR